MSLSLPLYLLLIPYGVFILVFAFYAFFNLFQLYKHGLNDAKTQFLGIGFVVLVAMILALTFIGAQYIDWAEVFTLDFISP